MPDSMGMDFGTDLLVNDLDRAEQLTVLQQPSLVGKHGALWDELHRYLERGQGQREHHSRPAQRQWCQIETKHPAPVLTHERGGGVTRGDFRVLLFLYGTQCVEHGIQATEVLHILHYGRRKPHSNARKSAPRRTVEI